MRQVFVSVVIVLALMLQGVPATQAKGDKRGRPTRPPRPQKIGFIAGFVTDAATGEPIRGALVRATSGSQPVPLRGEEPTLSKASHPIFNEYHAVTNGKGRYSMTVPAGDYALNASVTGYEDKSSKDLLTVQNRRTTRFDFALVEQGVGTVSGTVFGVAPDGAKTPLACAEVTVYPHNGVIILARNAILPESDSHDVSRPSIYPPPLYARTDTNGHFTIEDVPTGEVSVNSWRLGYGYDFEETTVTKDETTEVTLELPLQSATVRGVVTDDETGLPLAGALVTVRVLYDHVPLELIAETGVLRQSTGDHCPPPEAELIGVTDENGQYELLLPIYDVIAYAENARAGNARAPIPIEPRQVLVAFKRGYRVAQQTIENPQVGATVTVHFELTKLR